MLQSRSRLDAQHDPEHAAEREKQDAAREGEARRRRCREAQYERRVAQFEGPVFHLDEQGNRVYLEDDERAAKLKRARTAVKVDCR